MVNTHHRTDLIGSMVGPAGSTRTLLYLYYQLGFEQFDMGRASAAVVILMAIGLGLSLFQIQWKKKEVYI